ncbi:MAG: MipA/OmpV family protein [Kiritimatiellae bacterium]|nr:MipA/OmpV family protein [Kiritimatiellia bacterium]
MKVIQRSAIQLIALSLGIIYGGPFVFADEFKPAQIEGASTDAKYMEIPSGLEAAAEVDWFNSYVSRGQVNSDRPVIQPQIEITKYGVYINTWGNLDLSDQVSGGRDFSEVDFTLGYKLPVETVEVRLGVIDYVFPNVGAPETREAFVVLAYPNEIITPCLEGYYDFDEVNGVYLFLMLEHEFAFLGDKLRLIPGVSSGWGSSAYNDYFFDTAEGTLNDGNVYAELEYDIIENLALGVSAAYMWLWNSDIRDGARDIYMDTKHWTVGAKLIYGL